MKHRARFRFVTRDADVLYRSIRPEEEDLNDRSRARVSLEDGALLLEVEAADIAALRAALNMWLRLISVADEVHDRGQAHHQRNP